MRIATWNLDHASNGSRPVHLQLQQIRKVNPDVVVLTETCRKADLSEDGYASAVTIENQYGKHWTEIWTKYPIKRELETYDPETAVCIEVEAPLGDIMVYGTILTWHGDKGREKDSPAWLEHHRAILDHGDDLRKLIRQNGGTRPLLVCGDFNQTRDGSNAYCSKGGQSILMLDEQLKRNNLVCLTEENFGLKGLLSSDPKKGYPRNNIDHICATKGAFTVTKIGVWDHFLDSNTYLSDHNGVYVDVQRSVAARGRE